MFSLPNSWIVALEYDCENIQNDINDNAPQLIYLIDDSHKIYHLVGREGVKLEIHRTLDLPKKGLDMRKLQTSDWSRVHITQRTVVVDGLTYSLKSDLCSKLKVSDSKDFDGN